jgi:hypothetical protein
VARDLLFAFENQIYLFIFFDSFNRSLPDWQQTNKQTKKQRSIRRSIHFFHDTILYTAVPRRE